MHINFTTILSQTYVSHFPSHTTIHKGTVVILRLFNDHVSTVNVIYH